MMKIYKTLVLMLMLSSALFAQNYSISGTVTSTESGEKLVGANVYVKGTSLGAATDVDGNYTIAAVKAGTYTVVCSYIGFETIEENIDLTNNLELNYSLKDYQFSLNVTVLADRAKERETPVAFSNIDKKQMEQQLGSQDIPMILNTTPSVYATQQGGGAGDARINIRGFNQRNIAIMINGVPVNDMENGWVYWSNWDGVGDATSSIQLQRGLSAVNLATPSIGGTMNIITDPTAQKFGGMLKQELGNDGFLKTTLRANSGKMGKFAFNLSLVKKTGDGLINSTWTDAWAYYAGLSYEINENNRLELYANGAPQRHGQNLYKQNAATYDSTYAKDKLGYSIEDVGNFVEQGRKYNQNWNTVNSSYKGQQWTTSLWAFSPDGSAQDRYDPGFLNERENFFHKPIVNLNWYSKLSKKVSLYTTAYWSGGIGGGTGTYGDLYRRDAEGNLGGEDYKFYYGKGPWAWDWNETINANQGPAGDYYVDKTPITKADGESIGILRNSRNNQNTYGLISKAYWKVNDNWKTSVGIDWRTAEIDHYREVRDLLGGDYYVFDGNEFDTTPESQKKRLGDKIDYHNTNTVDWFGGYLQAEYSKDKLTAYGTVGYSTIKYGYTNHFMKNASGGELVTTSDMISGYQLKGGASYRFTGTNSVYFNAGYVSKVPIFDAVINDQNGDLINKDNELFTSFELGTNNKFAEGKVNTDLNLYFTDWGNRTITMNDFDVFTDDEGLFVVYGMDSRHMGVELEVNWMPIQLLRFDGVISYGSWEQTNNPDVDYKDYGASNDSSFTIYLDGVKVGDQPQSSLVLGASVFPIKGMSVQLLWKYYANYYAAWGAAQRADPDDQGQSWQAPNYSLLDFHFYYDLPFNFSGVTFQVFAHVFNILDATYIQDATDNSQYNGIYGSESHSAQAAEVFFGLPRSFNAGISIAFN